MLCCIFNYAPHYRKPIYEELENQFNAHFYFGERLRKEKIKKLDLKRLHGYQKELKVLFFNNPISWEWTIGMIKLAFKRKYKKFIITPNLWALNQWVFVFFCWILGKKVYTWEHGINAIKVRPFFLIQRKLFYSFIDGIFLYGNKARKNMIRLGFKPGKLHVIFNSLDFKKVLKIRDTLRPESIYSIHFKNNHPVLVFIGRLTQEKRLELLIAAHKILMDKGIKTNVVLIGEGEIIEGLKKQVVENNQASYFWFYGATYNENDIAKLLFNAYLCVSPGNVGLTAIHSFSYGLPVITNNNFSTQMPEHEIIENKETGLFFKDNDENSLAEKIEWWLVNKKNRDITHHKCFSQVEKFYNPFTQAKIIGRVLKDKR